jgi:NAD(P)-dependent dehydrogenase (short-subunit alcohol dehydrogenase family)
MSTTTRTAVVTGAARGIGAGVAERLAADGFAVAVIDLDETACKPVVQAIEAAGGRALAVGADVSDEQSVQAAVERIAAELGEPTVLVNNAGIIRDNLLASRNCSGRSAPTSGTPAGTPSGSGRSTCSPTRPATSSGSTSTPTRRPGVRSAAPSRTAT